MIDRERVQVRPNPMPSRSMSVLVDGVEVGSYEKKFGRGYRWRTVSGGHGDASTAHLAQVAILELSDPSAAWVHS